MNKILINILLFSTLVIGSIGLISFDVWADTKTGDVYEIPEDYKDRNYVIQIRTTGTGSKYIPDDNGKYTIQDSGSYILDSTYDFTIYYPGDMLCSLYLDNDSYGKTYTGFRFCYSEGNNSYGFNISDYEFDVNNIAKIEANYYVDNVKKTMLFYIKKNNCIQHGVYNLSEHGIYEEDILLSLRSLDRGYKIGDCTLFSVNNPFIRYSYSYSVNYGGQYDYNVYSGIYGKSYMVQNFHGENLTASAIRCVEKRIATNVSGVFPEPVMNKCNKVSDFTLHCFYEYPSQGRTPNFNYVYPKIYVKIDGKEWVEYQETDTSAKGFEHIFKFHVDNENQSIWGALSLLNLYIRMGYTYSEIRAEDFEPPKIEGIIWGVQYGYALTQNILDESSIRKSKIVFSRYVFEDNIVDTPDVGIGDLGDLPNISGSTSNIEVGTGGSGTTGGSLDRPGGGHRPGTGSTSGESTSVLDWITNFKFDFSSITNAISGTFTLAASFASMIGNVFQNFFGEGVATISLLAIAVCVILRLVGR